MYLIVLIKLLHYHQHDKNLLGTENLESPKVGSEVPLHKESGEWRENSESQHVSGPTLSQLKNNQFYKTNDSAIQSQIDLSLICSFKGLHT